MTKDCLKIRKFFASISFLGFYLQGIYGCLTVVIISQPNEFDMKIAEDLRSSLFNQSKALNETINVYATTDKLLRNSYGSWAVWPIIDILRSNMIESNEWLFFCETTTMIDVQLLLEFLRKFNVKREFFIGRALFDETPTIIHHFYGFNISEERKFYFPDFAAGIAISQALYRAFNSSIRFFNQFSIDAKHELSRVFLDSFGVSLTNAAQFCLLNDEQNCITRFVPPDYSKCPNKVTHENVFFAVKTFSGYHKTRIVVIKRTWARLAKFVEYFSDQEDLYIPTIHFAINNTERGHCMKTLAILQHFLSHHEMKVIPWFVLTDDDTLLSIPRLYKLLSCYQSESPLIIGERYGYGFNRDGTRGYDFPTGGSGIVFSRPAVKKLVKECRCPSIDSPDDMIIGMCAGRLHIPIIHSAAFHQARYTDYPSLYVKRIQPISFHKFDEIDPYEDFMKYLHETDTVPASRPLHLEL